MQPAWNQRVAVSVQGEHQHCDTQHRHSHTHRPLRRAAHSCRRRHTHRNIINKINSLCTRECTAAGTNQSTPWCLTCAGRQVCLCGQELRSRMGQRPLLTSSLLLFLLSSSKLRPNLPSSHLASTPHLHAEPVPAAPVSGGDVQVTHDPDRKTKYLIACERRYGLSFKQSLKHSQVDAGLGPDAALCLHHPVERGRRAAHCEDRERGC